MSKNVAVFVDVANIFYAAKAAGVDIDYVTLLKSATAGRDFVRAYAYTGLDPENENQRNFHQFLARNSYKVVSKDIRKYGDGRVKANLDIEMVVDMMKTARNLDVAVLVSGDGDFAPAIRAVQEMGVRVEVICFKANTSSDLIDVADQFIEITQIAKVEKGSGRSGRRIAGDEEDLSMTEVPEKQTEGATERRRRSRARSAEAAAAKTTKSTGRTATTTRRRGGSVTALPGEKLARAEETPEDADLDETAAEAADLDEVVEDRDEAAEDEPQTGEPEAGEAEVDGEGRRRRRRRRGRGRGRGRDGEPEEAPEYIAVEEADEPEPRRAPRAAAFGSVWDSQIGSSQPIRSSTPGVEDDDLEEPEIPEYLLAERRGGVGAGRGRGGSSRRDAYRSAVERERYGRGGGRSGAHRRDDGRGRDRDRTPYREPARAPRSAEGWSEVPPELEAMLRAQVAARGGPDQKGRSAAGAKPAVDAPEADKKPARRTRSTKAVASADSPATEETVATPDAKPARRTRATKAPAAEGATEKKPVRRTRTTKAAAAEDATNGTAAATAEKKPARRTRSTRATTAGS